MDFPEPEAPTMATVSPDAIIRLISSKMVKLPVASCTILLRLRASTAIFLASFISCAELS